MTSISLIQPSLAYKSQLLAYKNEFPPNASGIEGSAQIAFADSIEQWLEQIENDRHWESVQKDYMPSEQYIAVDNNNNIVGMLNFRKELNDYLLNYIGHIGYSVAPLHRGKGIATQMLKLALAEAKNFGLQKVLVTCTDDNVASYKVIENNGGILEDKRIDPGDQKLTRRYWITF